MAGTGMFRGSKPMTWEEADEDFHRREEQQMKNFYEEIRKKDERDERVRQEREGELKREQQGRGGKRTLAREIREERYNAALEAQ